MEFLLCNNFHNGALSAQINVVSNFFIYNQNLHRMNTTDQIGFISTRIKQLQSAVLHTFSNEVFDLPDLTVHAIDVDAKGCVWFSILKPKNDVGNCGKSFYVSLDFYRKALPFYLTISGAASFVANADEIKRLPGFLRSDITEDRLLVCVKIMQADYFEEEENKEKNWFQKCREMFGPAFHVKSYLPVFDQ